MQGDFVVVHPLPHFQNVFIAACLQPHQCEDFDPATTSATLETCQELISEN